MDKWQTRNEMNESPMSEDYLTFENQGHEVNSKDTESPDKQPDQAAAVISLKWRNVIIFICGLIASAIIIYGLVLAFQFSVDKKTFRKRHNEELENSVKGLIYKEVLTFLNSYDIKSIPIEGENLTGNEFVADFICYALENEYTDGPQSEINNFMDFYAFMLKYNKSYATFEDAIKAFLAFRYNYSMIRKHNFTKSTYKLDMNKFGDLRYVEFRSPNNQSYDDLVGSGIIGDILGYLRENLFGPTDKSDSSKIEGKSDDKVEAESPANLKIKRVKIAEFNENLDIDYERDGVTGDVGEQEDLRTSYAYAIASAIEATYKLKTDKDLFISAEELINCMPEKETRETDILSALKYTIVKGISKKLDNPYGKLCNLEKNNKIFVKEYLSISPDDILKALTYNGPLVVNIPTSMDIQFYKSGVYTGPCTYNAYQSVLLVGAGYDKESKKYFWKVKNSWGRDWGENGYMRIQVDNGFNDCKMVNPLLPVLEL